MKSNKRTKRSAIVALALAGAIAIGGAFAFLSDSESKINRFTFTDKDGEQTVDVSIDEPSWNEEDGQNMLPLDTVAKDPQVVNEGENDVYAYVTVLVPTAKSIDLNKDDGTVYTAEDIELFSYKVNEGWQEIDKTRIDGNNEALVSALKDADDVERTVSGLAKHDGLKIMTVGERAITNKAVTNANVYYTAHTYAYAVDGTMTVIGKDSRSSAVFSEVTMINIADGEQTKMSLEDVLAKITPDEGTEVAIVDDTIVATKGDATEVIYKTVDGFVVDMNGNKQLKAMSQLKAEDNINIYVNTYAIQADNLSTADMNEVWTICANTNANVTEGETYSDTFFFQIIENDLGHKSAVSA